MKPVTVAMMMPGDSEATLQAQRPQCPPSCHPPSPRACKGNRHDSLRHKGRHGLHPGGPPREEVGTATSPTALCLMGSMKDSTVVGALWVTIMGECFQGTIMAAYPYCVTPRAASRRCSKGGGWHGHLTHCPMLLDGQREGGLVAGALRGGIKGQD